MKALNKTRCAVAAALAAFSGSALAQFAYVPNEKTGTLSIIDLAKDEVIGSIPAGKNRAVLSRRSIERLFTSATSRTTRC